MAKLTAAARKRIPTKNFALPGRKEPINDKSHAKAALTMGMRDKSPAQKAKIRAAVHRKFPDLGKGEKTVKMKPMMKKSETKKPTHKKAMMKKNMKVSAHKAVGAQKGYTL